MTKKHWIMIGYVGKPWGLRGGFYVSSWLPLGTYSITKIRVGPRIKSWLEFSRLSPTEYQRYLKKTSIESVLSIKGIPGSSDASPETGRFLVTCDRVLVKEQAKSMAGMTILAHRNSLASTTTSTDNSHDFFWSDLLDHAVILANGSQVGHIFDLVSHGASDILLVQNSDGEVWDIPFTHKHVKIMFTDHGDISHLLCLMEFDDLEDYVTSRQRKKSASTPQ
ncbi:MAG: hypothetical protein OXC40_01535 [Proteobacteria bacterium]|nr:hypothetical protein [Pseudomonadota bacterium]